MASAIETLVLNIEATIAESKPVYRTLQKQLKELKDNHHVLVTVALNKDVQTLKAEARRIVAAFRNGTIEEAEVKSTVKKAQPKVTHTIDEDNTMVKTSEPKQVSLEMQLADAKAEIARLRQELADKTNEVAEYAEALSHANLTIRQQAQATALVQTVAEPTDANNSQGKPLDNLSDSFPTGADALVDLITRGFLPEFITTAYVIIKRKVGNYKANDVNREIGYITFVNEQQMAYDIREAFKYHCVDEQLLDEAIAKTDTSVAKDKQPEFDDNDAWVLANRKGYTITQENNGYAVRTKEGLIVTNKISTVEKLLQYISKL